MLNKGSRGGESVAICTMSLINRISRISRISLINRINLISLIILIGFMRLIRIIRLNVSLAAVMASQRRRLRTLFSAAG